MMCRARILSVLTVVVVGAGSAAQGQTLTWKARYESKLFINTIPIDDCIKSAAGLLGPGVAIAPEVFAAFVAFCHGTSLDENPSSPTVVQPLDARIRGGVDLTFTCTAGQTLPTSGDIIAFPANAGYEGPLPGIANSTATRDEINDTGEYAYVVSGHPNSLLEPVFQAFKLRATHDIWQHVVTDITCGTDGNGLPTATAKTRLVATLFPSHKIWSTAPAGHATPQLDITIPQVTFQALWSLPPIPAP